MVTWILLFILCYFVATLSGVAGFGGSLILLPLLSALLGVKAAVPVLTIAQIFGNISRWSFGFKEINWKTVFWFLIGGIPCAYISSQLFVTLSQELITQIIGIVLLVVVAWRRVKTKKIRINEKWFVLGGALSGFFSGISGVGGPIAAVFFLSYGLPAGAYVASEAMTATITHSIKTFVYQKGNLINLKGMAYGAFLGVAMVAGSWTGKRIIERLPREKFVLVVETMLVLSAVYFIVKAYL